MQSSEHIDQLAASLATAQGEMEHASKDRLNPAFKSRYADLASILDACREPLCKAGIAIIQAPSVDGCAVSVETRFVHKSGQWIATTITAQVADSKAQTIGSAVTYLRRYGLAAMAGVAPDDDDGAQASRAPAAPQPSIRDALKRLVERYPDLEQQALDIAQSHASDSTKIDRLRDLYKSQPQQESAQ